MFDVVVIGAGPAGSRIAAETASLGHDVLLLEKDTFPGEKNVCGGGLLQHFVSHIPLSHRARGKELRKWCYYFPKTEYTLDLPSLSFQRSDFDSYLARLAVMHGAKLQTSARVEDARFADDRVELKVKDVATGVKSTVSGRIVVFADGPCTMAWQKLGIGFHATPDNTALGAIYEVDWPDDPYDCFELYFDTRLSAWGYTWVFPKMDRLNVGVGCLMSMMKMNLRESLDIFVRKHPLMAKKLVGKRILRFAAACIPFAPARRISWRRTLVIGDAAGTADPIWGGGIGPAIQAAPVAAGVISEALASERFDAAFMAQYDLRWKKTRWYKEIRRRYYLSRLLQPYARLDSHAFVRMAEILVRSYGAKPADIVH